MDDEEEALYRELEIKYDKLYKEVYEQRMLVLLGEKAPAEELLKEYETRAKELDDEDYKKIEVTACDVKDIQNTPLGVPGFWMRAMLTHGGISRLIQEKDRPILMYLQDISCDLHNPGYGFDLTFTFEKNDYFKNAQLRKSFVMTRQNVIEKCDGTEIEWKDGKDVTKKKIKKKQKSKKGQAGKTITKTVEQESFFNFFKTIAMPDEKDLVDGKAPAKEPEDDEKPEKDVGELMDEDFDMGNEFKDQLIPLALEYYLEVIEEDEDDGEDDGEDDDECDDDECDDKHHGKGGDKDSDEDEKPAKGKKKKGGKGAEAGAAPNQ